MFTSTLIGDTKNIELRRRMVNVEFTDGAVTFAKEFQFKIDETVETIKTTVKQYLDELNFVQPTIDNLTPATKPADAAPTQAELDRQAWDLDVAKLKKVQELLDCSVVLSAGQLTNIATLRTRVATNFKPEYLG